MMNFSRLLLSAALVSGLYTIAPSAIAQSENWCQIAIQSHANNLGLATIEAYDLCLETEGLPESGRGMVFHQRGEAKRELGDYEGGIEDFNMALPLVPQPEKTYAARGLTYLTAGDYEQAIDDLSIAIDYAPEDWVNWYIQGLANEAAGNTRAALIGYSSALRFGPENASIMLRRANVRGELGDYKGAIADHSRVLAIDPDDASAYNGRAWNRFMAEIELEEALVDAERAVELSPEDFNSVDTVAHLLSSLGRPDESLVWFQKASDLGGEILITWYQEELAAKGYYDGAVDGLMNASTLVALEACVREDCRLLADANP